MKKITLFLIAILPLMGIAQTFDFTNSNDGWSLLHKFTAVNTADHYELTSSVGNGTLKNPDFEIPSGAGVDADTNSWVGITVQNVDANGPTYMRIAYRKTDDSGWVSKNAVITTGDADYQTYWIDLTNSNWTGTKDRFRIQFKSDNGSTAGTNYVIPSGAQIHINVDKIEFVVNPPTTERNIYEFNTDGDNEGWTGANGTIQGVTGGNLTFTPNADSFAKIILGTYHVNATDNPTMHVTLKNESTNDDELRVILPDNSQFINVAVTTSDTDFVTYNFDMSTLADWTGDVTGVKLAFRDVDNANGAGKSSGTGNFVIDRIWFDAVPVVSVNDNTLIDFNIYPNPATDVVNLTAKTKLSNVSIYNLLGKKVFETNNLVNDKINISALNAGLYIIKVIDVENKTASRKFVVTK